MLALGHARDAQVFLPEDEQNRTSGALRANRLTTAEMPIATLPPDRVRCWTLWIVLVVGGFLWQFVSMATGFLRP